MTRMFYSGKSGSISGLRRAPISELAGVTRARRGPSLCQSVKINSNIITEYRVSSAIIDRETSVQRLVAVSARRERSYERQAINIIEIMREIQ